MVAINLLSWTRHTEARSDWGRDGLLSTEQPGEVTCDVGPVKGSTSVSADKLGKEQARQREI